MKAEEHSKTCENFRDALKFGHIKIIFGEPQIIGRVPKDAILGNIISGEKYDPDKFVFNMVITWCPFCGIYLEKTKNAETN